MARGDTGLGWTDQGRRLTASGMKDSPRGIVRLSAWRDEVRRPVACHGRTLGSRVGLAGMRTTTKKALIDQITEETKEKRSTVKKIVQCFLEKVITELSGGNRLEFRDFGVFEIRERAPRVAQNPKTLERVPVPAKRTVKFKSGRMMKDAMDCPEKFAELRAAARYDDDDDEDDMDNGVEITTTRRRSRQVNTTDD